MNTLELGSGVLKISRHANPVAAVVQSHAGPHPIAVLVCTVRVATPATLRKAIEQASVASQLPWTDHVAAGRQGWRVHRPCKRQILKA